MLTQNGEAAAAAHCPPDSHERIMHARLALFGGGILMAGDCLGNSDYDGIKGVALTLNYDSVTEAEQRFSALAAGGRVTMTLQPTFRARTWGMLVDRCGTPWIVHWELLPI